MLKHLTWPIVKRSIIIAIFVGTLLSVINHSDKMMEGSITLADMLRMALTYLVPFCVAVAGALSARAESESKDSNAE